MSFANPFGTKVSDIDSVSGAELTAAGVAIERALDGTGGGTYTPAAVLEINGSGIKTSALGASTWTGRQTIAGGANGGIVHRLDNAAAVTGLAAVTIDPSKDTYIFGSPTAARTITVKIGGTPAPVAGQRITVVRPDTGAFAYTLINETLGTTIAILGSLTWVTLTMEFNGTKWLVIATTDPAGVGTGGKP